MIPLKGRTFLVTGASSGIGAALCEQLLSHGANVLGVTRRPGALHPDVSPIKADLTSREDISAIFHGLGKIDGLINCAGIAIAERTLGREAPHKLASFSRVITVNLIGTFNMIRLASFEMAKAGPNAAGERGVIVNTASVAAFDGQIGQAAYAASKGGVVGMTLPIARDLSRIGIRVCTIAPGIFETPMLMGLPKEAQDSLGKQVPFPSRLGRPTEYAQLVRSIVENEMLNAETIRLDGAIRMAPK